MLFLEIISWKGVSCFNGGVCFSDGGASFLSGGGHSIGEHQFWGGGFLKKNHKMGGATPMPPPTMGNLDVCHRIGTPTSKMQKTIARFVNRKNCEKVLANKKNS